jgi:hypothetical protein
MDGSSGRFDVERAREADVSTDKKRPSAYHPYCINDQGILWTFEKRLLKCVDID